MNFYFCETCNKRITDADLAAGSGRNKKVKGVFCKDCAAGVNTLEFESLNEAEAREVLAQASPPQVRPSQRSMPAQASHPVSNRTTARMAERTSSRTGNAMNAGPTKQSNWILIAAAAGVGIGLTVVLILFSGGESKPPVAAKLPDAPKAAVVTANRVESEKRAVENTALKQTANVETNSEKTPVAAQVAEKLARSEEELAADAFDAATKKINALGEDKLNERRNLADAFLKQYPESIQAARMRVKVQEWSAPKPAPVAPVASDKSSAPPAPTATSEKETRILFECSLATKEGLASYSEGVCEDADVFGVKSKIWKAELIPNPPWHSTKMGMNVQNHVKEPVKITANTWVRFACRLENGKNLMMHAGIGDGIYEIHQNNLPENKWFWTSFKMSDFTRDFHSSDPKPKAGAAFNWIAIMAGADKIPCALRIEKFQIGEGPIPKD